MPQSSSPPPELRCLCATVRRAARLLTRRYEEALEPSGLTPGQFELLMHLRQAGARDQGQLAAALESDQTTLSRNLRPMLRERWVAEERDRRDGRRRIYRITSLGEAVLADAQGRWRSMQRQMERRLGEPLPALWPALDRIVAAAREPAAELPQE